MDTLTSATGGERWWAAGSGTVKDLQGEGLAYFGLSHDLAHLLKQRDRVERELRDLMKRLEAFAIEGIPVFLQAVEAADTEGKATKRACWFWRRR